MVGLLIGLLVDSYEALKLGVRLRKYIRRMKEGKHVDVPREVEEDISRIYGGAIGSQVVSAFIKYIETGDEKPIESIIESYSNLDEVAITVDVTDRRPEVRFQAEYHRRPEYTYRLVREGGLKPEEFPMVAKSIGKLIQLTANIHPEAKKMLILSTPVALAFQVGQTIGTRYRIHLLHLHTPKGKYVEISPISHP